MGALKDPRTSYTISTRRYVGISIDQENSPTTAKALVILNDDCVGKSYNEKYVSFVGQIEDLDEGDHTLTLELLVNGQVKASQTYEANGTIGFDLPCLQANVVAGDLVAIRSSTDQPNADDSVVVQFPAFIEVAGSIDPQICS